jgi:hypothetical protein
MPCIQRTDRQVSVHSRTLLFLSLFAACADSGSAPNQSNELNNQPMLSSNDASDQLIDGGRLPALDVKSPPVVASEAEFSFFVTSFRAMQRLSGSEAGFGGDLRYGEADGLTGADKICREIAETALPGAGKKTWRAFLSATRGPFGMPVHALERIGSGPWYDRLGRLVAPTPVDLMANRPLHGDQTIALDLPNEDGVPNHAPDGVELDNHDTLTGSSVAGRLSSLDWASTCHDWTSAVGRDGRPRVGHSWPRLVAGSLPVDGGVKGAFAAQFAHDLAADYTSSWASALDEAGCAPGASLVEMGAPNPDNPTVGSGGGYGGIYCFVAR